MQKNSEFTLRRARLLAKLEPNSVALVFNGCERRSGNSDEFLPFCPNSNFLYLCNVTQAASILLLVKQESGPKEYLFIEETDELKEKWIGRRINIDEARDFSDVQNVLPISSYPVIFESLLEKEEFTLYLDHAPEIKIKDAYSIKDLIVDLSKEHKGLKIADLKPLMAQLRLVKSASEIQNIKEAIRLTDVGINAVLNSIEPKLYEYQLRALFEYAITDQQNTTLAFPSIVASGINATILHYPQAASKIKDGDLVLFDVGARFNNYCADISRTIPASGKFNPLQRKIYEIVLGCNKHIINMVKPGISIMQLQNETLKYLEQECLKQELVKPGFDIKNVYYHGVSHHLGLDTHDLADGIDRASPLEPGNVITVEPGLYFKEYGIGIRIEDDVLVTSSGAENLSKAIVKEIIDLEN